MQINKIKNKYLNLLSMMYITFLLVAVVLSTFIVDIRGFIFNEGAIIIPFMYLLGDIITEVYGYDKSKMLIYYSLFCEVIFILLIIWMIKLPNPTNWHDREAYMIVFRTLKNVLLANLVAIPLSEFLNILVLSKTKKLLYGKFFGFRSLFSSTIGELSLAITGNVITFFDRVPIDELLKILVSSFIIKVTFSCIFVIPATIFVAILKQLENIETHNHLGFVLFDVKK